MNGLSIEVARKVLTAVDAGLVRGKGVQEPGKMCIEAAVCYALGLPHSDEPPCVGVAVRAYKIRLNDSSWSSGAARAKGMRRVAIAQLGSNELNQRAFREFVALETIRRILPIAMRAAASRAVEPHKSAITAKTEACEKAANLTAARIAALDAKKVCLAAAAAAYTATAAAAYTAAADAAAAAAAVDDAAAAAAAAVARDKVLSLAAEIAVEALIELKSPGCEWLWICDETPA